ncbi:threonine--tRNA ligase [Candidatus Roizmanbacteria bacterium CG_4_8_14_3_um_filter_34_9]|uniref:Threonine--tRNA ligase n=3 Tax=Candidatus Roizmaniibacteriota TaxID=1752723 RepID=A0A2M6YVQ9_9BACT|nr:MAG: threonine--tRNA ligase [Candidatus Roizmanbacteria bacterium CG07_land_8_20_14_0_80_34_15]PIW73369.1 MAG: threonine--tRNA ligase [Candidatus Roizmanbacteria bacterium CG_4_8_14_3_um_filter_34_9]
MKNNLNSLRHSCAHLLAAAVLFYYPDAKLTLGPSIENGFYYDIDFGPSASSGQFSEKEFPKIEQKMHELSKKWIKFEGVEVDKNEALKQFKGNEYKEDLIKGIVDKKEKITIYKSGEFSDLCRGGHVDNPKESLKHFKLLSIAGAYWRGNEKNKMLTRIYGTIFPTKEELDAYLKMIEEAKKRDHRKIGRELELFTINNEVGPGITLWLPNGSIIRREIENYMVTEQTKLGFKHVYSPHIGRKSLWEKSGHWDLYRQKMYSPMDVDGEEYLVKPMTCPMHIQSFTFNPKSYRDLPYRIAEIGSVYRYEQSGELAGLLRVRAFTQDDAHIFCTQEQAVDEFISVFNFINKLYKVFGFKDYRVRLGVRSKKEKYLGEDSLWKKAQEKAIEALDKTGAKYSISEGDAAFYGPKADFMIKDALGREWQCGTVQIDFMLPERFDLKYIDTDGKEKTPVMIHRAPLGSLERFMAILIEQYAGAFPLWLSPIQVAVLPISEKFLEPAEKVKEELLNNNIRVTLNDENKSLGGKIRNSTLQKIPFMIIIGEKEVMGYGLGVRGGGKIRITVRTREGKDLGMMEVNKFINLLKSQIENFS